MPEWSFQRRLITGMVLIGLLAILASGASLFASRSLITRMASVATGESRDLADARALQLIGVKCIADVRACLLTGGAQWAPAAIAASSQLRTLATSLQTRIGDSKGLALLDDVVAAERAHEGAFQRALIVSGPSERTPAASYLESVLLSAEQLERSLALFVTQRRIGQDSQPGAVAGGREPR